MLGIATFDFQLVGFGCMHDFFYAFIVGLGFFVEPLCFRVVNGKESGQVLDLIRNACLTKLFGWTHRIFYSYINITWLPYYWISAKMEPLFLYWVIEHAYSTCSNNTDVGLVTSLICSLFQGCNKLNIIIMGMLLTQIWSIQLMHESEINFWVCLPFTCSYNWLLYWFFEDVYAM